MGTEAIEEFSLSLKELVLNSKPQINMLTMLAEDSVVYSAEIVKVIEKHLHTAKDSVRLPTLYLMDSIIKNIPKSNYKELFTTNIADSFCAVFEKVNEKMRQSLFKLRQTWTPLFPNEVMYSLDLRVKQLDPAWPIISKQVPDESINPASSTLLSSIHINPKFIKKKDHNESSLADKTSSSSSVNIGSVSSSHINDDDSFIDAQARAVAEAEAKLKATKAEILRLKQEQLERELEQAKKQLEAERLSSTHTTDAKQSTAAAAAAAPQTQITDNKESSSAIRDPRLRVHTEPRSLFNEIKQTTRPLQQYNRHNYQATTASVPPFIAATPTPAVDDVKRKDPEVGSFDPDSVSQSEESPDDYFNPPKLYPQEHDQEHPQEHDQNESNDSERQQVNLRHRDNPEGDLRGRGNTRGNLRRGVARINKDDTRHGLHNRENPGRRRMDQRSTGRLDKEGEGRDYREPYRRDRRRTNTRSRSRSPRNNRERGRAEQSDQRDGRNKERETKHERERRRDRSRATNKRDDRRKRGIGEVTDSEENKSKVMKSEGRSEESKSPAHPSNIPESQGNLKAMKAFRIPKSRLPADTNKDSSSYQTPLPNTPTEPISEPPMSRPSGEPPLSRPTGEPPLRRPRGEPPSSRPDYSTNAPYNEQRMDDYNQPPPSGPQRPFQHPPQRPVPPASPHLLSSPSPPLRQRRPSLSVEQQNIKIPNQLLNSNADEILKQAEEQLKSGHLSERNHQELIQQLSQLYKLQKIKQQIMDEKTHLKNTVEEQERGHYQGGYSSSTGPPQEGPYPGGKKNNTHRAWLNHKDKKPLGPPPTGPPPPRPPIIRPPPPPMSARPPVRPVPPSKPPGIPPIKPSTSPIKQEADKVSTVCKPDGPPPPIPQCLPPTVRPSLRPVKPPPPLMPSLRPGGQKTRMQSSESSKSLPDQTESLRQDPRQDPRLFKEMDQDEEDGSVMSPTRIVSPTMVKSPTRIMSPTMVKSPTMVHSPTSVESPKPVDIVTTTSTSSDYKTNTTTTKSSSSSDSNSDISKQHPELAYIDNLPPHLRPTPDEVKELVKKLNKGSKSAPSSKPREKNNKGADERKQRRQDGEKEGREKLPPRHPVMPIKDPSFKRKSAPIKRPPGGVGGGGMMANIPYELPYDDRMYYIPEHDPRWLKGSRRHSTMMSDLDANFLVVNNVLYSIKVGFTRITLTDDRSMLFVEYDQEHRQIKIKGCIDGEIEGVYNLNDPITHVVINNRRLSVYFRGGLRRLFIDRFLFNVYADAPPLSISIANRSHDIQINSQNGLIYIDGYVLCKYGVDNDRVKIASQMHKVTFNPQPKSILFDAQRSEIRFRPTYTYISLRHGDYGIRFDGEPATLMIGNVTYSIMLDRPSVITLPMDGSKHLISIGGPGHEVIIGGVCHEVKFNGPEVDVQIGALTLPVKLKGICPTVKLLGELVTDPKKIKGLCDGREEEIDPSVAIHQAKECIPRFIPPSGGLKPAPLPRGPRPGWAGQMLPIRRPVRPIRHDMPPAPMGPMPLRGMGPRGFLPPRMPKHEEPVVPEPNTVQNQIDVDNLLASLVSKGLISASADAAEAKANNNPESKENKQEIKPTTTNQSEEQPEAKDEKKKEEVIPDMTDLQIDTMKKRHNGVLQQLYQGIRCTQCGLRFTSVNLDNYNTHLDWHFRQNSRGKDEPGMATSRGWYYMLPDWIRHEQTAFTDQNKLDDNNGEITEDLSAETTAENDLTNTKNSTIYADNKEKQFCEICHEEFEQTWDDDEECWRLKDAVRVQGHTCHRQCCQDIDQITSSDSSQLTTPTLDEPPTQEDSLVTNPLSYLINMSSKINTATTTTTTVTTTTADDGEQSEDQKEIKEEIKEEKDETAGGVEIKQEGNGDVKQEVVGQETIKQEVMETGTVETEPVKQEVMETETAEAEVTVKQEVIEPEAVKQEVIEGKSAEEAGKSEDMEQDQSETASTTPTTTTTAAAQSETAEAASTTVNR